jgi:hypothetical protein
VTPSATPDQPEQLRLPLAPRVDPELVFLRVFRRLGLRRPIPDIRVQYRPYAGLRSTIVLRSNRIEVRISDLLTEAPPIVLEALAEILLGQVFRRRPSREARACYLSYVYSPAMRPRVDAVRQQRGSVRLLPPQGRVYDLREIFGKLNRKFFHGRLKPPRLGWTLKRSRTLLGHYDSAHGAISISRWLDAPRVARHVVEYVIFHEMLHTRYPVERDGPRRVVHSREFREAEKKFPKFEQIRRRLRQMCY